MHGTMLSPPPPQTIPFIAPDPTPLNSFRQVYTIGGEPYVIITERWREGETPPGTVGIPHSLMPGSVLTGYAIRTRTGERINPASASLEVVEAEVVG